MKQHEAVIVTMERLGGIATLGQLYREVLSIPNCKWGTKTPYASIRRIVQTRNEIYKIKPGLYGLVSKRSSIEAEGILQETAKTIRAKEVVESSHAYYQGLLLIVGKLERYATFAPHQDRNRRFLKATIGETRTLTEIPSFSYPELVKRSQTVDVIWFNERHMPDRFFEIEFSGDLQNSLLKFTDLQDFNARKVIVLDASRRKECLAKLRRTAFEPIQDRLDVKTFQWAVKYYEWLMTDGS